jgi:hypothetical protein
MNLFMILYILMIYMLFIIKLTFKMIAIINEIFNIFIIII